MVIIKVDIMQDYKSLQAPHLSSEFVLLGDLNWDMLNTPEFLQSNLDALNLTQIIKEPKMYNIKSATMAPS